jgi:hypothetical protein
MMLKEFIKNVTLEVVGRKVEVKFYRYHTGRVMRIQAEVELTAEDLIIIDGETLERLEGEIAVQAVHAIMARTLIANP